MSNYPWLKFWNETPDDPKWLAVADLAGCTPQTAFYTFWKAASYANEHDRAGGHITGLHPQVIASFCRVTLAEVSRIFQAFRELRMLIGDRIANWTKRQMEKLAKPRSSNAERQAKHRAKVAAEAAQATIEFPGMAAPPPQAVTPREPVTLSHEALHSSVTLAADLNSDSDSSEANASEREPAVAEVVQIKDHQKEKKADRAQRRSRLPADWRPDDQDRQFAFGKGYDDAWIEEQAAACVDYSLAHGKAYFDFHAYWRTWVNNAPRFGNAARSPAGRRSEPPSLIAAACAALAFGDVDPFEH